MKKGTWAKAERSGGTSQKSTEKEKDVGTTPTAKVTIGIRIEEQGLGCK